jgi:large subunit ribosomal protein L15
LYEYYTDPKNRGYLADPEEVRKARIELAQKFGYQLPEFNDDNKKQLLLKQKDPRQIFIILTHSGS